MDRSFFRRSSRDTSPLLPQHSSPSSYPLADLPPRPYSDSLSASPSRRSQTSNSPLPSSRRPHVQFSYPPPPLISSVLLNPTQPQVTLSSSPSQSTSLLKSKVPVATNPLMSLSRREKAIQADLQLLLDAQGVGLVQGRIGDQHGDDISSDAGSSTPTSRSMVLSTSRNREDSSRNGSRGVIPIRQPRRKKIGLNGARKGILRAMVELSNVKQHEAAIVSDEINTIQAILRQVDRWEKKMSSFENEMKRISEGSETREMSELRTEKTAVETEIRELEDRLLSLRARDRHLSRRIEEVGNRKEAEMSSFREGRRGVESEIKDFLKRPPILEVASAIAIVAGIGDRSSGTDAFLALPPKRRTLAMARDFLTTNLQCLTNYQASATKERQALDEGATTWADAIVVVRAFEDSLREQFRGGKPLVVEILQAELQKMADVVADLGTKAREADTKGWNLLICALGAELEAFREGEVMLRNVLVALEGGTSEVGEGSRGRTAGDLLDGVGDVDGKGYLENWNVDGKQAYAAASLDNHADMGGASLGLQGEDGPPETKKGSTGDFRVLNATAKEKRDRSPYRSETESEDEGPPAALLVGVQDEDDG